MSEPILYILMRNDMASLNPGKACAQAAHAANLFISDASYHNDLVRDSMIKGWAGDRGFGTTIVLAASESQIRTILARIDIAFSMGKFFPNSLIHRNTVIDPTYPIADGQTTHHINIMTCAYVFGDPDDVRPYLSELGLMP